MLRYFMYAHIVFEMYPGNSKFSFLLSRHAITAPDANLGLLLSLLPALKDQLAPVREKVLLNLIDLIIFSSRPL
jgi:hypothetical protein